MVCLTMSLPLFSQTAMDTDSLISIPTNHARQIASELTLYDFCKQERDSLQAEILNLEQIIVQNNILLEEYQNVSDSLFESNEDCFNAMSALQLDINEKNDKIGKLKTTRNFTFLTTLLTAILPVLLK